MRLILIRHAKAADGRPDIDRPLAPRGRRDATATGTALAGAGLVPDRVVVSPAVRAQETWQRAADALSGLPAPVIEDRIYANDVQALLDVIQDTPEDVQTLVLVGHNPSFADLAAALDDGSGDTAARTALADGLPTASIAVFEVSGRWSSVSENTATLTSLTTARGD